MILEVSRITALPQRVRIGRLLTDVTLQTGHSVGICGTAV
jgi:hypothetical protein